MEINRSYSIPLSGGLGYQPHTHTHALAQAHPSAFDHTLRHSQDTVHTGISDINRSLHDSVHSIHSLHAHGHGHGHSGDIRGRIDDNCNNNDSNDNENDASSEKCESMSLDFGHNMESMSIDDGTCLPVCPSAYLFFHFHTEASFYLLTYVCLFVFVYVRTFTCGCFSSG